MTDPVNETGVALTSLENISSGYHTQSSYVVSDVSVSKSKRLKRSFFKTIEDYSIAVPALVVAAPIIAVAALAIRIESKGSMLFKQQRGGKDGKAFTIYKMRTMTTDACKDEKGDHAQHNDPRITKVGYILRKLSIDELPQLINVLKGDMHIIGPRPYMVYHDEVYRDKVFRYDDRFRVKPGITGLCHVNVTGLRGLVKDDEDMQQRVDWDNEYIDNWSLWMDVKILFKTLRVFIQ